MPSDHPETQSVEGDPMVLTHPRDMILYARSSYMYYHNNMFLFFSDIILIL